jgi:hypothetical protein
MSSLLFSNVENSKNKEKPLNELVSKLLTCTICTIYTKVCGRPFELVDSAILATPVADRCIKSSTQPYNLHRQTLAVEWSY